TASVHVSAANVAPVVEAGPDQTITLPSAAALAGAVSDDGLPAAAHVTSVWSKVSGPGTVAFADPSNPLTTATFDQPGTYVLRLSASDSLLSASADVTIAVLKPNTAPTVTAGGPYVATINQPLTFAGSASDADNDPLTIAWEFGDGSSGAGT